MDTPADLAVAFLALERGLLDHRQLLSAWEEWAARPGLPLGGLLVQRGLLSTEAHEEMRRQAAAGPGPASLTQTPTTEISGPPPSPQGMLQAVAGPTAPPPGDDSPGRYRRTELHARGGMGEVWQARDDRLDRVVALKELQARWQGQEQMRRRFLAEARVTGKLEHPGI